MQGFSLMASGRPEEADEGPALEQQLLGAFITALPQSPVGLRAILLCGSQPDKAHIDLSSSIFNLSSFLHVPVTSSVAHHRGTPVLIHFFFSFRHLSTLTSEQSFAF